MTYKIEMNHITKVFGSLVANDDVTLKVKPAEIHALLGENGAGKSTLMSILFGLYQAEDGDIIIDGEKVTILNPNDANDLGIGMVHQHFKLVDTFSVLDNIILGAEDTKYGVISYEEARKKLENLIEKYHLKVELDALIKDITVGQQQRVEILKMLYRDSNILIFDEPTAVLTPQEIHDLMGIMRNFAKEGKTIILITHKLNEIKEVADRCTVLRRGKMIGTVNVNETSVEEMATMMVGRKVSFTIDKPEVNKGEVIFSVENLNLEGKGKKILSNINLTVSRGEIVGIAGIDGNGQTEFVQAITGLIPTHQGKVMLNGKDITKASIRKKYEIGMSHIPEDRQKHGVVLDFNLESNMVIQNYYQKEFQNKSFLKFKQIREYTNNLIEKFDIRSERGAETDLRSMSGGNQQKAILGREISRNHELLIAVQPTRGLDVGAIEFIHKQLIEERSRQKGILLVSLELDEILDLSDRILVMYEGEIVAELDPKKTNYDEIGLYMSGGKRGLKA